MRLRIFHLAICLAACFGVSVLSGCAGLSGYPDDPQNATNLTILRNTYFSPDSEDRYKAAGTAERQGIRNEIVLKRMQIYDMEFSLFARDLSSANNSISIGSDLTALALSGLGATTGNAATKAALSAASGGVIAANGAIDKDLFYQKTVPAIIAQMQANRVKAETTVLQGLQKTDADYPLPRADLDLDVLNDAGSLNAAIATITQASTNAKEQTQANMDTYRSLAMSRTASSVQLNAWLFPSGALNTDHLISLQAWMTKNSNAIFQRMPVETFVNGNSDVIETARVQAIADLAIK